MMASERCTTRLDRPKTILTRASRTRISSVLLEAVLEEEVERPTSTRRISIPCLRISLEERSEEGNEAEEEAALKEKETKILWSRSSWTSTSQSMGLRR